MYVCVFVYTVKKKITCVLWAAFHYLDHQSSQCLQLRTISCLLTQGLILDKEKFIFKSGILLYKKVISKKTLISDWPHVGCYIPTLKKKKSNLEGDIEKKSAPPT